MLGLKVDGAEQASKLEYNPAGQVISVDVGTLTAQQITDTYEYDPATLLLKNERVLRSGASMLTLDYAYSPARQLVSLLDTNAVADDRSYTYDGLGRIAFVSGGEVREPQWTQAYDYDIYGNRSKCVTQTQEGTPCPDKGVDASGIPRDGLQLKFDSTTNHVSLPGFTYDSAGTRQGLSGRMALGSIIDTISLAGYRRLGRTMATSWK